MQRGIATFTLDYGRCPPWLFERMVKLGKSITEVLVEEYGPEEFIKRIADPVWFQSLGTVLAFDWNASGLTTILTAALKEAIRFQEKDLGIFICGGKGKTSRKTPDEITTWGQRLNLQQANINQFIYNSKMSAKVDSSLIQDSYQIYHHAFFFTRSGAWTVVQQGMNTDTQTARRYHWHSKDVKDFITEPHSGIASQITHQSVLNMTDKQSAKTQTVSIELLREGFKQIWHDLELLDKHQTKVSRVARVKIDGEPVTLAEYNDKDHLIVNNAAWDKPIGFEEFFNSPYLKKILVKLAEQKPEDYERFLATEGVGPKTVRALALVAEVIYGAKPSYNDPARYSFAHGGKDAIPYPVDRPTYDETIEILKDIVQKSKINVVEKDKILKRLR
ncbi:DUF763 domain-containing protein [Candidatus Daviesbacteria bacterium]|nr:DUF763 domain-containing protein [Candidatus Daviesbacteria bacterium]